MENWQVLAQQLAQKNKAGTRQTIPEPGTLLLLEDRIRRRRGLAASSGSNCYSAGAVMGTWVGPYGVNKTNVTVLTKRRVKTNLFTTLTEGTFHRRFAQEIRIVNSGNSLPAMLPDSYEGTVRNLWFVRPAVPIQPTMKKCLSLRWTVLADLLRPIRTSSQ